MDHLAAARAGLEKIWAALIADLKAKGDKAKGSYTQFEADKKDYEASLSEVEKFKAQYPGIAKGGPKKVKTKRAKAAKPVKRIKKVARRVKAKAAKKKVAKKATKKARGTSAAAEGRRAVARGDRPPIRQSMARVMGTKVMSATDIVEGLTKKNWLPGAKDPRTYCLYTLSANKDVFERVSRGRYKVKAGVTFDKKAKKTKKTKKNDKPAAEVKAGLADLGIKDDNIEANPFSSTPS